MKFSYLFNVSVIVLLLFTSSCNKELPIQTVEKRIIGTWKFQRVKMKSKGSACYNDVTDNFRRYTIQFNLDYTLVYFDSKSGNSYDGWWYIWEVEEWDSNNEEYKTTQTIESSIYDHIQDTSRVMTWNDISISTKKLKFKETRNDIKYKYTLVK